MSATSPTQLSYDVFVSDGPAGAGDERMPAGAPLAWSPLSSTLIFGARDALLVDPPWTGWPAFIRAPSSRATRTRTGPMIQPSSAKPGSISRT